MANKKPAKLWVLNLMGLSQSSHLCFSRLLLPSSSRNLFSTLIPEKANPTKSFKTFAQIFQQCSVSRTPSQGKQAHCRMIVSGFDSTVFVTNCLLQMYVKCSNLDYAIKVFDEMPDRDTVSFNTLIFGFAGIGKMETAQSIFDAMPVKDVVSWNSIISGYLKNGDHKKSVSVCLQMRSAGFEFDPTSLAIVLKACSGIEDSGLGIQIHCVAIKMGYDVDVVTGSALLDMYAKCKRLGFSLQVFNEMSRKNKVTWSAIIAGCVQNDRYLKGLEIFRDMISKGIETSQSSYASVFRSCAGLLAYRLGTQIHGHSIKEDFSSDTLVGTATLDMYAKCRSMSEARKLFDSMPSHNLQSYNALIIGYTRVQRGNEALCLFHSLQREFDLSFDEVTLSGAFGACAVVRGYVEGIQLHGLAVKSRLKSNTCVANAILDMYGKCGSLAEASLVFDEIEERDAVSWNTIIAASEQNDDDSNWNMAFHNFVSMIRARMEPDQFTFGSILKACAATGNSNRGAEIHSRIIKSGMGRDSFVGGALVDMYCKCAMVEEAEKIHARVDEQTMVSWNAIVSGYTQTKRSNDAQTFFSWMMESGIEPDTFTYAAILDTCANLATVGLGMQIHARVVKRRLQADSYISSTLVDMYSKCGKMKDSQLVFEKAGVRDPVTWNAMICGYANHGLGDDAIRVFEAMKLENIRPNQVTFVSVLRACAHIGNVEKGLHYFHSMKTVHNLAPQMEHYSCMVDLIGRSGELDEAIRLIREMPFEADAVVWRTMLGVCKLHGNIEMAEMAARNLLRLEPQDSSCYVLLSNIYADSEMWEEMSQTRREMKSNRLKKEPGCSWIEVKDELHAFLVGDKAHPKREEVYERLHLLVSEMKWIGHMHEEEDQLRTFMIDA